MTIAFDPIEKLIILSDIEYTSTEIYSRWKEWVLASDNSKWAEAMSTLGGEPLGGGLFVARYYFLENGWRIRPAEMDHTLTIDGNLTVAGGVGDITVPTLGSYNVLVKNVVPVQAQGIEIAVIAGEVLDQIAQRVWSDSDGYTSGQKGEELRRARVSSHLAEILSS